MGERHDVFNNNSTELILFHRKNEIINASQRALNNIKHLLNGQNIFNSAITEEGEFLGRLNVFSNSE